MSEQARPAIFLSDYDSCNRRLYMPCRWLHLVLPYQSPISRLSALPGSYSVVLASSSECQGYTGGGTSPPKFRQSNCRSNALFLPKKTWKSPSATTLAQTDFVLRWSKHPADTSIACENRDLKMTTIATEKGDVPTGTIAGSGSGESNRPTPGSVTENDENLEVGTTAEDESTYVTGQKRVLLSLALALAVFIVGTVRVEHLLSR